MSTKSKRTVKATNHIKAKQADRQRTKHMALGFGVIALLGTAAVATAKAIYDVASETI